MPTNPLSVAIKGKGVFSLLKRTQSIAARYGLTGSKMDGALALLAGALQPFGGKATLPVTAVTAARHSSIVKKYQEQGIEFAVHGLVHVDHTRLSPDGLQAHLQDASRIFRQTGIRAAGFRCPYLRWNNDTLEALRKSGFIYDSSQALAWDVVDGLETGAYHHVLGFYGAQSAGNYPALPRIDNGLVRIPYCLPDDEALVERLQLANGRAMAEIWTEILYRTHHNGELFTIGLHPERTALCRQALQITLQKAASLSPPVWIARLDEIAAWWQTLAAVTFETTQAGPDKLRLRINAPGSAGVLVRGVAVEAPTTPWAGNYQAVPKSEFMLNTPTRPFIGISPGSPPALADFLQQQGYLVEISPNARTYPFYLDRTGFEPADERPLLARIEQAEWPLVRLGRWPHRAQSALSVTGDIDAFTLWDYGLRIVGR